MEVQLVPLLQVLCQRDNLNPHAVQVVVDVESAPVLTEGPLIESHPAHMGEAFLEVYQGIVSQRIEAKRTGDKVTNEAMNTGQESNYQPCRPA